MLMTGSSRMQSKNYRLTDKRHYEYRIRITAVAVHKCCKLYILVFIFGKRTTAIFIKPLLSYYNTSFLIFHK